MAYLDLSAGAPSFEGRTDDRPGDRPLATQQRLVVLLSRTDPLWSLRPRHPHSRLLGFLFGIEAPHHLADPKLEALRRYAVTCRLRDASVAEAERAVATTGLAESQLAEVRAMIDAARMAPPPKGFGQRRAIAVTV